MIWIINNDRGRTVSDIDIARLWRSFDFAKDRLATPWGREPRNDWFLNYYIAQILHRISYRGYRVTDAQLRIPKALDWRAFFDMRPDWVSDDYVQSCRGELYRRDPLIYPQYKDYQNERLIRPWR